MIAVTDLAPVMLVASQPNMPAVGMALQVR